MRISKFLVREGYICFLTAQSVIKRFSAVMSVQVVFETLGVGTWGTPGFFGESPVPLRVVWIEYPKTSNGEFYFIFGNPKVPWGWGFYNLEGVCKHYALHYVWPTQNHKSPYKITNFFFLMLEITLIPE